MEQRRIGNTDLVCSALGFGTWEMSTTSYGEIDVDKAISAVSAAIDHGIDLAEHAERLLSQDQRFEVVTPASLAIVSFSYRAAEPDAVNLGIVEALIEDGHAMVSSTRLAGRVVLRLCTINPRTTPADIESTVALLGRLGDEVADGLRG